MKFFVVFAFVVAAASAGILAPDAPILVAQHQHLPVIGPNGVPVDTVEVQQARAAHLVHKAEAHARNGDVAVVAHAPVIAHALAAPVVAHVGIAETPEVIAAKHAHFAAHAEALARNGHIAPIHHLFRRGIYAVAAQAYPTTHGVPAVTADGTPLETPEVVAAKANHFVAHAEALARNAPVYAAPIVTPAVLAHAAPIAVAHSIPTAYATTLGHPAVTANGVPLETPEVVSAKINHFAAHAEALARNSPIYSEAVIAAPIATVW